MTEAEADLFISENDPQLAAYLRLEVFVRRQTCHHKVLGRIIGVAGVVCLDCGEPEDRMDPTIRRGFRW
jgi:hypothetical protein